MTFIEFLGFLVMMFAFAILIMRRIFEERRRQMNPEAYKQEQTEKEKALKEFLRTLQIDVEEGSPPPPPEPLPISEEVDFIEETGTHRTVRKQFRLRSEIEKERDISVVGDREFKPRMEDRYERVHLGEGVVSSELALEDLERRFPGVDRMFPGEEKAKPSRARALVSGLKSRKEMIILHEIIGPPKG